MTGNGGQTATVVRPAVRAQTALRASTQKPVCAVKCYRAEAKQPEDRTRLGPQVDELIAKISNLAFEGVGLAGDAIVRIVQAVVPGPRAETIGPDLSAVAV